MPNTPYLDASVRWRIKAGALEAEEPGYASRAEAILSAGLATDVVRLISAGKEADVYLCTVNGAPIAVKAYRLFRTSHRGGGPVKADAMGWRAAREFELMRQAWKAGVRVPAPARRAEAMFSMRYLGTAEGPAPRLQDMELDDPQSLLDDLVDSVRALAKAGVVHGDLSAFNVLLHDGRLWLIDFSESIRVDRTGAAPWVRLTEASTALTRGLNALNTYFRRYRVKIEVEPIVSAIVRELDRFDVLR